MKTRTRDYTEYSMYLALALCLFFIILLTTRNCNFLVFDNYSQTVATVCGGVFQAVFSFFTLGVLLQAYLGETRDRNFRQTIDLIEKTQKIYSDIYTSYLKEGKNKITFNIASSDENIPIVNNEANEPLIPKSGIIIPYLKQTEALFDATYSSFENQFSILQFKALVSLFNAALRPLIDKMNNEIEIIGKDDHIEGYQIISKQLSDLDELHTKAKSMKS